MGHSPGERARVSVLRWLIALASLVVSSFAAAPNTNVVDLLLVVGASGEQEYAQAFQEEVQDWMNACHSGNKSFQVIDPARTNQLELFTAALTNQPPSDQELWIVLIGHGTFDGRDAKFNLAGPDLSATNCAQILNSVPRPLIFIDTSSASAPFLNQLSATNRIVITATKSGFEENYARFGKFFARAISDPTADLDKDGQVSLLEAFLSATHQVEDFYKSERRLATEHALLDDNGDGKGTPASFYRGVRPAKTSDDASSVDGFRAHQIHFVPNEAEARMSPALRKRRNDLEIELERLRGHKASLSEEAYLKEIEPTLLDLARLYRGAEKPAGTDPK